MNYQNITYESGTVARVILNRPHKLNAQCWNLLWEMDDAHRIRDCPFQGDSSSASFLRPRVVANKMPHS